MMKKLIAALFSLLLISCQVPSQKVESNSNTNIQTQIYDDGPRLRIHKNSIIIGDGLATTGEYQLIFSVCKWSTNQTIYTTTMTPEELDVVSTVILRAIQDKLKYIK